MPLQRPGDDERKAGEGPSARFERDSSSSDDDRPSTSAPQPQPRPPSPPPPAPSPQPARNRSSSSGTSIQEEPEEEREEREERDSDEGTADDTADGSSENAEDAENEEDAAALRDAAVDARLAPVFLGISASCATTYRSRGAHLVIAAHCLFSLFVLWAARTPRSRLFAGPQRSWYRGRTWAVVAALWRLSFSGGAQVNAGFGRGAPPPASAREMKALAFWASRQGPLMAPLVLLTTGFKNPRATRAMVAAYLAVQLGLQSRSCAGIEACFPTSRSHYVRAAEAIDGVAASAMGVAAAVAATSRASRAPPISSPASSGPSSPSPLSSPPPPFSSPAAWTRLSEERACFRVMSFVFLSTAATVLLFDAMSRSSSPSPEQQRKREQERLRALRRRRRRRRRRQRLRDGGDDGDSEGSTCSDSGVDEGRETSPAAAEEPARAWRLSLLVANSPWIVLSMFCSWIALALVDDYFYVRGGGVGVGGGGSVGNGNNGTRAPRVSHFGAKPCSSEYSFLGNSASLFGPRL